MALTVQALRCREAALLDVCGRAEIAMLSAAVMDVSAAKCREFYSSAEVQCNTGRKIKAIYDFVREKRLVSSLPAGKLPFKKPAILTEDLAEFGTESGRTTGWEEVGNYVKIR